MADFLRQFVVNFDMPTHRRAVAGDRVFVDGVIAALTNHDTAAPFEVFGQRLPAKARSLTLTDAWSRSVSEHSYAHLAQRSAGGLTTALPEPIWPRVTEVIRR